MAKYSFEFKKKVVLEYINKGIGSTTLASKYNISTEKQVRSWVHAYKEYGDDGLMRSRRKEQYSFEYKLHVVELYLSTEVSYEELAFAEGIKNPSMIARWVSAFRVAGPDGLRQRKLGRKKTLSKDHKKRVISNNDAVVNTSAEHVKELEDELLKLRIENAYFKRTEEAAFRRGSSSERTARIVHSLRREFKLKDILAVLKFPKATYMYWQKRFDRTDPDEDIKKRILEIRENNKDYGYRRICGELNNNQGIKINKKKVQSIVQGLGIQVTSFTRKSRRYSSYKGKVGTIAPNRIRRRFKTHIPHQKITTDTSEFKYYTIDSKGRMIMEKLYLDPFMDMFNGEIVSFGIDKHPSASSIMNALNEAIEITSDCPYRRTFHSDQGWAYQMKAYTRRLKEERIFQSMSRKGNCHDNSVMENFFGLLKQEIYYGVVYYSYEELKSEIERFIKYYNEQRIKERLGWLSPVQYRLSKMVA
ncbi:IS3 family transposase [Butyrivibrio sp. DSM 10294]|uniref:IS3 family transposase n=1 Tax=Butyrivibrio sp. DSM 10294 TaxID=2972457 RepID=UPI00234F65B1|nr:IS3 family transposase [Butyrivibrio sp. DSM 10294]MDC7294629.1 IS3 family transposase [Butyrivibrio sp. DSM 10294]